MQISQQQFEQPQIVQEKRSLLFYLGIGGFEVGFVLITLIVIFTILIYFHLISLSSLQTLIPFSSIRRTDSPRELQKIEPTPQIFTVQSQQIKNIFSSYLMTTLVSTYIPQNFDPLQKNNEVFGTWALDKQKFLATVTLNKSSDSADISNTQVTIPTTSPIIDTQHANQLTQQYFPNSPKNPLWNCSKTAKFTYCETFSQDSQKSQGYAIFTFTTDNSRVNSFVTAISCTIPQTSSLFLAKKSCMNL